MTYTVKEYRELELPFSAGKTRIARHWLHRMFWSDRQEYDKLFDKYNGIINEVNKQEFLAELNTWIKG